VNRSDSIGALAAALAKAQKVITNPPLDSVNPHFKNRYASLAAHLAAVREPLADQGIALMQSISTPTGGGICVTTMLLHSSGEWLSDEVSMPLPERATAQQLGSCVSYLRRYALASCCLIVGEDEDDGEADRLERTTRPQETTKYSYPSKTSAPAAAPAPKSAPAKPAASSPPKQTEGHGRKWADQGTDVVAVEKVVDRGNFVSAVLCSHPTQGRQWVSVPDSMLPNVKVGQTMELEWDWDKAGFYVARRVSAPPKPSDLLKPTPKPEPKFKAPISEDEVPF